MATRSYEPMVLVACKPMTLIVLAGLMVMAIHFLHAGRKRATLPGAEASMTTLEFITAKGVSELLIACQIDTPNAYRLIKSPMTKSCMHSVLEKQIVRRTNRLIRVRRLMCLLSIFCVWAFPIVCCSASRCRS